ncbi:MAG TPA: endopeptidase La, partial [Bacteroidales bacterium]|nr:endopeptidase La [Bacteroidales bacterium]
MEDHLESGIIGLSEILSGDTEFIPLMSTEEEKQMHEEEVPDRLPILPLRNTVLFPGVVIPITVGRDKSIRLIRDSYAADRIIGVVAQQDPNIEDPGPADLHSIGTVAHIIKLLQMPDGNTTAIIQGKRRFNLRQVIQEQPYMLAQVQAFSDVDNVAHAGREAEALFQSLKELSLEIIRLSPNIPSDASFAIKNIESPAFLVNFISSNLNNAIEEKQHLLELSDLHERARLVLGFLTRELQMLEIRNQIQSKVKNDIDKQQRDYFLNQQLKTIQEELGGNPMEQEIEELKKKASLKKWNKDVKETFERELGKLQRMNPAAAEYSVQTNYLEVLVDLPWGEYTTDNFDLDRAQKILDNDHFGLEKVKERIIEHLAVLKLRNNLRSPIVCLVGPPGVGKTSLGKSIASALGRRYVRMSLGGLRDEAEIRGHRKTYIGAMPGRIIQSLRKARSANPVFVLDEIDKVSGNNVSGDPSAALLEVLDPEQNVSFYDNFLEVEFDLSNIMFIATANSLMNVHPALRDRMEVIDISGYLLEEKVEIARRHLIPRQLTENGVRKSQISFSRKVIEQLVDDYTRESGVRQLEKTVAKVIRSKARDIAMDRPYEKKVDIGELQGMLGAPIFKKEMTFTNRIAGVATGLAWTQVGGEILFIEVSLSPGKGNLTITGNLGEVMKESAAIAFEF